MAQHAGDEGPRRIAAARARGCTSSETIAVRGVHRCPPARQPVEIGTRARAGRRPAQKLPAFICAVAHAVPRPRTSHRWMSGRTGSAPTDRRAWPRESPPRRAPAPRAGRGPSPRTPSASVRASASAVPPRASLHTANVVPSPPNTNGNVAPPSAFITASPPRRRAMLTSQWSGRDRPGRAGTTSVTPIHQSPGSGDSGIPQHPPSLVKGASAAYQSADERCPAGAPTWASAPRRPTGSDGFRKSPRSADCTCTSPGRGAVARA